VHVTPHVTPVHTVHRRYLFDNYLLPLLLESVSYSRSPLSQPAKRLAKQRREPSIDGLSDKLMIFIKDILIDM
jgi:hypothetical protein